MFKRRSRSTPPRPLPSASDPAATLAASQAFLANRSVSFRLSESAAAAALRSHVTTPVPISDVRTERMQRRASISSNMMTSTGPRKQHDLRRQSSISSMSERTFRSSSPHVRERPASSQGPYLHAPPKRVPPVPAVPRNYMSRPNSAMSLGHQHAIPSGTASKPSANASALSAHSLDAASAAAHYATRRVSVNYSRPMSPQNFSPRPRAHSFRDGYTPQATTKSPQKQSPQSTGLTRGDLAPPSVNRAPPSVVQNTPQQMSTAHDVTGVLAEEAHSGPLQGELVEPCPTISCQKLVDENLGHDEELSLNQHLMSSPPKSDACCIMPKRPSVVKEDHEGEQLAEEAQKPSLKTNKSDKVGEICKGDQEIHDQNLSPPYIDKHQSMSMGHERRISLSPIRAAHFATQPAHGFLKHQPPDRSVSPAKSAMKHASSRSQVTSPARPSNLGFSQKPIVSLSEVSHDNLTNKRINSKENLLSSTHKHSFADVLEPVRLETATIRPTPVLPLFGSIGRKVSATQGTQNGPATELKGNLHEEGWTNSIAPSPSQTLNTNVNDFPHATSITVVSTANQSTIEEQTKQRSGACDLSNTNGTNTPDLSTDGPPITPQPHHDLSQDPSRGKADRLADNSVDDVRENSAPIISSITKAKIEVLPENQSTNQLVNDSRSVGMPQTSGNTGNEISNTTVLMIPSKDSKSNVKGSTRAPTNDSRQKDGRNSNSTNEPESRSKIEPVLSKATVRGSKVVSQSNSSNAFAQGPVETDPTADTQSLVSKEPRRRLKSAVTTSLGTRESDSKDLHLSLRGNLVANLRDPSSCLVVDPDSDSESSYKRSKRSRSHSASHRMRHSMRSPKLETLPRGGLGSLSRDAVPSATTNLQVLENPKVTMRQSLRQSTPNAQTFNKSYSNYNSRTQNDRRSSSRFSLTRNLRTRTSRTNFDIASVAPSIRRSEDSSDGSIPRLTSKESRFADSSEEDLPNILISNKRAALSSRRASAVDVLKEPPEVTQAKPDAGPGQRTTFVGINPSPSKSHLGRVPEPIESSSKASDDKSLSKKRGTFSSFWHKKDRVSDDQIPRKEHNSYNHQSLSILGVAGAELPPKSQAATNASNQTIEDYPVQSHALTSDPKTYSKPGRLQRRNVSRRPGTGHDTGAGWPLPFSGTLRNQSMPPSLSDKHGGLSTKSITPRRPSFSERRKTLDDVPIVQSSSSPLQTIAKKKRIPFWRKALNLY